MDFSTLITFSIITLSQTVSIGPGVALIISESLTYGAKKAITTSIYIRFGEIVVMIVTLFSIALAINLEKHLDTIKTCGGGYLIFLGITRLIKRKGSKGNKANIPFLIPMLNPKAFLFFAAFMPSFIKNNSNFNTDFLLLCIIFIIVSLLTDLIYICICLTIRGRINSSFSKYVNFISSLFILLTGAYLFFFMICRQGVLPYISRPLPDVAGRRPLRPLLSAPLSIIAPPEEPITTTIPAG